MALTMSYKHLPLIGGSMHLQRMRRLKPDHYKSVGGGEPAQLPRTDLFDRKASSSMQQRIAFFFPATTRFIGRLASPLLSLCLSAVIG